MVFLISTCINSSENFESFWTHPIWASWLNFWVSWVLSVCSISTCCEYSFQHEVFVTEREMPKFLFPRFYFLMVCEFQYLLNLWSKCLFLQSVSLLQSEQKLRSDQKLWSLLIECHLSQKSLVNSLLICLPAKIQSILNIAAKLLSTIVHLKPELSQLAETHVIHNLCSICWTTRLYLWLTIKFQIFQNEINFIDKQFAYIFYNQVKN